MQICKPKSFLSSHLPSDTIVLNNLPKNTKQAPSLLTHAKLQTGNDSVDLQEKSEHFAKHYVYGNNGVDDGRASGKCDCLRRVH